MHFLGLIARIYVKLFFLATFFNCPLQVFSQLKKVFSNVTSTTKVTKVLGAPSITITVTSPTCFNHLGVAGGVTGNGIILANATGGTPPYVYEIQNLTPQQVNGYFPGLSEGSYLVVVTDAHGIKSSQPVTLVNSEPQPILLLNVITLPTSCTSMDGSFELLPSGGVGPYTYSLDGGTTYQSISPILSNLQQGFYTIYSRDANGCLAGAITTSWPLNANYFFNYSCPLQISGGVL